MKSRLKSRFVISLQESFIAVVPYFLVSALLVLIVQFIGYFNINLSFVTFFQLVQIVKIVSISSFVVISVSISYHFAIRYNISQIVNISLSLISLITISSIINLQFENQRYIFSFNGFSFLTVTVPIVTTFVLKGLSKKFDISLDHLDAHIYLSRIFTHIYSFIISYICIMVIYLGSIYMYVYIKSFNNIDFSFLQFSDNSLLFVRTFLSQIYWFLGFHGPHMVNVFFDSSFLANEIYPNLKYAQFYHLFGLSGGSGIGFSLIIALLLAGYKDKKSMSIVKLSFPFAIFNINEILIYGLPVVFNRYLVFPFILVPVVNLSVAYFFLSFYEPVFNGVVTSWVTPVFFDAYMSTNGDIGVIFLQLFLIVLGVLIYYPFVKRYVKAQSIDNHFETLKKNLNISSKLKSKEGTSMYEAQRDIIASNYKIEKIVQLLREDTIMVYYQPKVDISKGSCNSFEALIRVKLDNGDIVGPYFLDDIEKAGLAEVIDIYVCEEVKKDLESWSKRDFHPKISINLHPNTLSDKITIKEIADIFKNRDVEFEVIERAFINNEAKDNLVFLKEKNFKISLDDFGKGYSSFETIYNFDIDTLKIDKSIIDMILNDRGHSICKHIAKLSDDLGIECVAEGVETEEQLNILKKLDIKFIQGFYFSKAIPFEKVMDFSKRFNEKI